VPTSGTLDKDFFYRLPPVGHLVKKIIFFKKTLSSALSGALGKENNFFKKYLPSASIRALGKENNFFLKKCLPSSAKKIFFLKKIFVECLE
jgi:hypothetical protein